MFYTKMWCHMTKHSSRSVFLSHTKCLFLNWCFMERSNCSLSLRSEKNVCVLQDKPTSGTDSCTLTLTITHTQTSQFLFMSLLWKLLSYFYSSSLFAITDEWFSMHTRAHTHTRTELSRQEIFNTNTQRMSNIWFKKTSQMQNVTVKNWKK